MTEPRPTGIDVLLHHGINISPTSFISRQQDTQLAINPAVHADVTIVTDPETGIQYVEKTFGRKREIPVEFARDLVDDYETMFLDYETVGIHHLAANYNLAVSSRFERAELTVEQLYFPEGTALDWIRNRQKIDRVVKAIAADCLIPTLTYLDDRIHPEESWVYLDASLKNFAVLEDGDDVKTYYLDFWVPRVRNDDGTIKTFPNFHPHKIPEEEVRQRFFLKSGILQNFIKKTWTDLEGFPLSWLEFEASLDQELGEFLEIFFPRLSLEDIAQLE